MMRKKSGRKRRRQGKGKGIVNSQIFSEFSEVYVCVCVCASIKSVALIHLAISTSCQATSRPLPRLASQL